MYMYPVEGYLPKEEKTRKQEIANNWQVFVSSGVIVLTFSILSAFTTPALLVFNLLPLAMCLFAVFELLTPNLSLKKKRKTTLPKGFDRSKHKYLRTIKGHTQLPSGTTRVANDDDSADEEAALLKN